MVKWFLWDFRRSYRSVLWADNLSTGHVCFHRGGHCRTHGRLRLTSVFFDQPGMDLANDTIQLRICESELPNTCHRTKVLALQGIEIAGGDKIELQTPVVGVHGRSSCGTTPAISFSAFKARQSRTRAFPM